MRARAGGDPASVAALGQPIAGLLTMRAARADPGPGLAGRAWPEAGPSPSSEQSPGLFAPGRGFSAHHCLLPRDTTCQPGGTEASGPMRSGLVGAVDAAAMVC